MYPIKVIGMRGKAPRATTYQNSFHGQSQLPPLRQTDDAFDHMTYPTVFKLPDASFNTDIQVSSMLTCATVFNYSVDMKAIISDLLDSYKYVQSQTGLRKDLHKAGAVIDMDPRRCAALGWSAGGSSVIYLVSLGSGGNWKWQGFLMFQFVAI